MKKLLNTAAAVCVAGAFALVLSAPSQAAARYVHARHHGYHTSHVVPHRVRSAPAYAYAPDRGDDSYAMAPSFDGSDWSGCATDGTYGKGKDLYACY